MAQEPKTDKTDLEEYFRLVSLNQEFLSATASLGTFIRSHPTTKPSDHFQNYMKEIQSNLRILTEDPGKIKTGKNEIQKSALFYENLYRELLDITPAENREKEIQERLQEVQIIMDRLNWLLEVSEGLKKIMSKEVKSHPFEVA
jgi:uncharacterized membrane protein YccC